MEEKSKAAALRELLVQPGVLTIPGCYDSFCARLVERSGFSAAYMTGFGSSASVLGLPDTGLMDGSQMIAQAANMAAAISIPLIADGDTGYGNPVNVHRTVSMYARHDVAAIQLEDQVYPKRCGHTGDIELVPVSEMVAKLRAALEAAAKKDIVVIARTDARGVHGFEAALERCLAFEEAGADVIFLEAPTSIEEMGRVAEVIKKPLIANLVEGGKTPFVDVPTLEKLGFKIGLYPISLLLSVARTIEAQLKHLADGDYAQLTQGQVSFETLKDIVGFPDYYEMQSRFRRSEARGDEDAPG